MEIKDLLQLAINRNASDLHLISGYYPSLRINGDLHQFNNLSIITPEISQRMIFSIITEEQKENLLANKEIDFGYEYSGYRFRTNAYFANRTLNADFRVIPKEIKTLEQLSLPTDLYNITDCKQGLVLITGPTGEGKSTTLASLISRINSKFSKHIITIEDPVEYVYPKARSIISQRELHRDTHSWNIALRSALRQDPDVILIGEMRDYETVQLAMTAAETGHLIFSTLHTQSAKDSITRIIDVFPSGQQNQIRSQLSSALHVIITQRLLPRSDIVGRIPAIELLFNNSAVASNIRDRNYHLIDNILATSGSEDMILFEKYLVGLYKSGKISKETAKAYSLRPKEFEILIG